MGGQVGASDFTEHGQKFVPFALVAAAKAVDLGVIHRSVAANQLGPQIPVKSGKGEPELIQKDQLLKCVGRTPFICHQWIVKPGNRGGIGPTINQP